MVYAPKPGMNTSSYSRLLSKSLLTQRPSMTKKEENIAVCVYNLST